MHSVTFRTGSVGLLVSWPVQPERPRVQRLDEREPACMQSPYKHAFMHNLSPVRVPFPSHSGL
jgi:hypothetical protein